jgi:hypothetical protein
MSPLLVENLHAAAWIDQTKARLGRQSMFEKLTGAVVWSEASGPDGKLIVDADPAALVAEINVNGFPLLKGHDPGFPVGKAIAAEVFTGVDGKKFVAAVIGYYDSARLSFLDVGIDSFPAIPPPARLPGLPDECWIELAIDPREVDSRWTEDVIHGAPLRIKSTELSHNAADSVHELIRLGLYYTILVWNPLIKSIATEAGKDAYASIHHWLQRLLDKVAELRDPILEIQSHYSDCCVSFILRGKDVSRHYAALGTLSSGARQAQYLITNMKSRGFPAKSLVYEFHSQQNRWFPSYAELCDGRLVTDNKLLIAIEQLPSSVSLGLGLGSE